MRFPFLLTALLLPLGVPASAQMPYTPPEAPPDVPGASAPAAPPPPAPNGPALSQVVIDGMLSGPVSRLHLEPARIVYGGELTLDADEAEADWKAGEYTLTGHVHAHEADTTLRAQRVMFNGKSGPAGSGEATEALLTRGVFSLRAPRISGTPEKIVAQNASLTTVPNGGRADISVRAQTVTLDQVAERATLRSASVYLFGTRLLTVPRITFRLGRRGGLARRKFRLPILGVSARYGTFVSFGSSVQAGPVPLQYRILLPTRQSVEAVITSQQALYTPPPLRSAEAPEPPRPTLLDRIRAAATLPTPPLPEGDPLRFHDFLPDPNPILLFDARSRGALGLDENLSVHVASRGRRRDDLYVSRLPEVTLSGLLPLTRPVPPTAYGDPAAFRAALRRLALYADASETLGRYREQPTNITASRSQTRFGLSAYPLLIAPNTVLQPRLSLSTSRYSGSKKAYRYQQLVLTVNHYFSELTAVGVQFLASNTSGDSPFSFDVLDTTRELDVRAQTGSRHLVLAGRVRYDLSRSNVYDYQISVAPALRGFLPVFSYTFRTRSLGLGFEARGLTF